MPKLRHIAITTPDVEKTAKFYIEVFGMKEVGKINDPGTTGCFLTDGELNLAILKFKNGAIGSLDYSWAWPDGLMNGYRAAFEIVGIKTAAALDVSDQGLYFVDDAGTSGGDTHLWPEINGRIAGGLADELDHFVTATLTRKPYLQHYREAYDAIPVLDALAASVQGGQPVDVAR